MKVDLQITEEFARDYKKLLKKHRSLKKDIEELSESLIIDPYQGTKITDSFYKIRIRIKSKGKGKSGGGRVITNVNNIVDDQDSVLVILIALYDKSDQSSIKVVELKKIVENFTTEEE